MANLYYALKNLDQLCQTEKMAQQLDAGKMAKFIFLCETQEIKMLNIEVTMSPTPLTLLLITSLTSSQPSRDRTSNNANIALPILSKLKLWGLALQLKET